MQNPRPFCAYRCAERAGFCFAGVYSIENKCRKLQKISVEGSVWQANDFENSNTRPFGRAEEYVKS